MTVRASGPKTGVTRDDGRGVKNQDGRQQDVTSRSSGWTTVVTRHDGPPVVDVLKNIVDFLKLLWVIVLIEKLPTRKLTKRKCD